MQRKVNADYYLNNQKTISQQDEKYSKMGMQCETVPADLNNALVPTTKPDLMDTSGLEEIQDDIRDRFQLDSGDDDDDDSDY